MSSETKFNNIFRRLPIRIQDKIYPFQVKISWSECNYENYEELLEHISKMKKSGIKMSWRYDNTGPIVQFKREKDKLQFLLKR